MSARTLLTALLVTGSAIVFWPDGQPTLSAGPGVADGAPVSPGQAGQDITTTLDDQSELAITVYNSNIALVRDVRTLQLTRGIGSRWGSRRAPSTSFGCGRTSFPGRSSTVILCSTTSSRSAEKMRRI